MNNDDSSTLSYKELRAVVGVLAFALPVILIVGGIVIEGYSVQDSISSYYYTNLRGVFVGILFITGAFLFTYRPTKCYKDGSFDSVLGDFACIFAIGVALFPTDPTVLSTLSAEVIESCTKVVEVCSQEVIGKLHFVFAALYFITLIIFAGFLFTKSDKPEGAMGTQKERRNRIYRWCAGIMAACIILIGIYSWRLEGKYDLLDYFKPVLVLETAAIWAFGISWFTKAEILIYKDKD